MSKKALTNKDVMPCGIYCPDCPMFKKGKCAGGTSGCRRCKTIYVCAKSRGIEFCFECKSTRVNFPCARFKTFDKTWKKYGQDLIKNQNFLKENGLKEFLNKKKLKS